MIHIPNMSVVQIRNLHRRPSEAAVREEADFDREHPTIALELHAMPKADRENAWVAVMQDAKDSMDRYWLKQLELL